MELHKIDCGIFKLDGGAMFGVVPKVIWNEKYPSDENNLCNWSLRALLVISGKRNVLIDSCCGDKQDNLFFRHYYLDLTRNLKSSLKELGVHPDEITDHVLTHLHFDHGGGSVEYNDAKTELKLTFPNATHWIGKAPWELANNPNAREKASFLKENFVPIKESSLKKKTYSLTEILKFKTGLVLEDDLILDDNSNLGNELKEILKYKKQAIKLCKNKSNRLKKIDYEPNKSDSRNIQLVNKQSQMINNLESMIKKLESSLD